MVEQVRISPEEVRGYGNVCEEHSLDDFTVNVSSLSKVSEEVHGAVTNTYKLLYSVYGLMFDFDKGAKQLYLQTNEANTLSLNFDSENKQLYLVDENDTGFSLDFDEDTNELYITDDAPPIVHNYSLALDQSSYTTTGSLSVSATLLDDGVAVSGATVSFTGGVSTVTATTNSSGVATATVNFTSSGTLTATYSNVSDTATVTVQTVTYLFQDAGVTGNYNTNYTNVNNANISVTVDSTGTNMYCPSGSGDKFRKANVLISGDFEIKYTVVDASNVFGSIRFLSSTNSALFTVEQYIDNTVAVQNTQYSMGETMSMPFTMTIQRVNGKLTVWYNNNQVATDVSVSTNDGYFAWKFYANDHRNQKFKDLTITQL